MFAASPDYNFLLPIMFTFSLLYFAISHVAEVMLLHVSMLLG